jgi:prevent-host-death family protein
MTTVINIHEAKTHLSRIIEEVARGKAVIIGKAGKPMARLVPMTPEVRPKKLGTLKGKIRVSDNFNDPLPAAILAAFGLNVHGK